MFDLKRPCVNCPFRKGVGETFRLPRLRLRRIKNGPAFPCHKTIDYDASEGSEDGDNRGTAYKPGGPQQCAGLMAVLQREGQENQIMQVAGRLKTDLSGIDPKNEAYASWADVLEAHCGGEDE